MLDLNVLRRDFDEVKQRLADRAAPELLDQFASADEKRRAAVTEIEELKRRRNEFTSQVAAAKKSGADASGQVALWFEGSTIAHFANLKITLR